jgi:AsmA protein
VAIETLELNLEINASGRSNWQDLMELSDAAAEAPEAPSGDPTKLEIGGIEVHNASVSYRDRQLNEDYQLLGFSLTSGAVIDGEPVHLASSFGFRLSPADISGEIEMKTELAYDRNTGIVLLSDFSLDGLIEGVAEMPTTLSISIPTLEANTVEEVMAPGEVRVSVAGVDLTADVEPFSYAGEPTPVASINIAPFSPRSLMQRMDIEAPETTDPNALGRVSIDGKATVGKNTISLSELVLVLDDTTFKGGLVVPRDASGTYRLDLVADTIDLNRYMAPADETEVEIDANAPPIEIPSDIIRSLNARGSLKIAEAHLGGLKFESVVLELNAANGDLRLHPISATFFDGTYNGDVRINVAGEVPVLTVNENIRGVQLGPMALAMFAQDNISGEISGSFKLSGRGQDFDEIQRNLNGSMSFELRDGTLEGTDVWYEIRRARALIKQEAAPEPNLPPRTKFSSMTASGIVTDGVFRNNDLVADLPFMRVTGKGSVNLPAASLDYRMTARVLERPEFAQGATDAELDEFTEAVIPLRITGPLASPSVRPDVANMLKQEVENELKRLLTEKLLGGSSKEEPADAGASGDEEPEKIEDLKDLEDVAKRALFDLLKN